MRIKRTPRTAVKRIKRTRARPGGKPRFAVDFNWPWEKKFQLYLMTSFLYYHMNRSVITNDEYDKICNDLAAGWKTGKHQHKHLVTLADVKAVTGYAIKYPSMVIGGAMMLLENHCEV
jgi:hypothetical protein